MKSLIYLGMDVHKNTYNIYAYNSTNGEVLAEVQCAADIKAVLKLCDTVKKKVGDDVCFKAGYEAGCLGYSLYHQLIAVGIDCDIIAPTTMQRSAKNKVIKNDRMDARNIAANLVSGSYRTVYVPDKFDIEVKEYIRMHYDFKKSLKVVKQNIKSFLLRHGLSYDGRANWTKGFFDWLKNLELNFVMRETLDEYLLQAHALIDKIERFKKRIQEFAMHERYCEKVSELKCFKGIDTLSATTIHVEISDFHRFPNAKAFASYLGLTPGDHSSGDKLNRTGITKQGNRLVRTVLIECSQALIKGTIGQKGKGLIARQSGQTSEVIHYADTAIERLQRKYYSMVYRGIKHNVAITAVARELACFIWGMETGRIH